jgi:hypothetical protein
MAINQNHQFEDLGGVKCAIVEKNVAPERVEFLRRLLEHNGFTVVVVPSPPPKATPATAPAAAPPKTTPAEPPAAVPAASSSPPASPPPAAAPPETAPLPETFTVGVTNVMFNPINAIFGRLLKTPDGHTVTLAYWRQQENQPDDERPYFTP